MGACMALRVYQGSDKRRRREVRRVGGGGGVSNEKNQMVSIRSWLRVTCKRSKVSTEAFFLPEQHASYISHISGWTNLFPGQISPRLNVT